VELDANTIKGMALGLARAELAPGQGAAHVELGACRWPGFASHSVSKFGNGIAGSVLLGTPASVSRATFPGNFDLGARAQVSWRFLRAQVAAMNGNPLGDASFPASRFQNSAKDFVGRLGMDATVAQGPCNRWRFLR